MKDVKKKALSHLSSKDKKEMYRKAVSKQEGEISPETLKSYKETMLEEMGLDKEPVDELDEVEKQAEAYRKKKKAIIQRIRNRK